VLDNGSGIDQKRIAGCRMGLRADLIGATLDIGARPLRLSPHAIKTHRAGKTKQKLRLNTSNE
jgi:hypothetical protein